MKTYIAYSPKRDEYKIGRSENPIRRISQLRTACPDIVLKVVFNSEMEAKLHLHFVDDRIYKNHEWFSSSKELIEFVKNNELELVKKFVPTFPILKPVTQRRYPLVDKSPEQLPKPLKGNRNGHFESKS